MKNVENKITSITENLKNFVEKYLVSYKKREIKEKETQNEQDYKENYENDVNQSFMNISFF